MVIKVDRSPVTGETAGSSCKYMLTAICVLSRLLLQHAGTHGARRALYRSLPRRRTKLLNVLQP